MSKDKNSPLGNIYFYVHWVKPYLVNCGWARLIMRRRIAAKVGEGCIFHGGADTHLIYAWYTWYTPDYQVLIYTLYTPDTPDIHLIYSWWGWYTPHCHLILNHRSHINGSSNPIPTSGHFTLGSPPSPLSPSLLASSLNPQNLSLLLIIYRSLPPSLPRPDSQSADFWRWSPLLHNSQSGTRVENHYVSRSDPNHNLSPQYESISVFLAVGKPPFRIVSEHQDVRAQRRGSM